MKKTPYLPAAFLASFAWAGTATLAAPDIQDGSTIGDSVIALDCTQPQSDSDLIWKCDSIFVEDSISAAKAVKPVEPESDPAWEDARESVTDDPRNSIVVERTYPGWSGFFWGILEAIADSDNGDDRASSSDDSPRELFEPKSERPSRERGIRRR